MNNKQQHFENKEQQERDLSSGSEAKEQLILSEVLVDTSRNHEDQDLPRPPLIPVPHSSEVVEEKEVEHIRALPEHPLHGNEAKPSVSTSFSRDTSVSTSFSRDTSVSTSFSRDTSQIRSVLHVSFVEQDGERKQLSTNSVLDHKCVINGSDYSSEEEGVLLNSTIRVNGDVSLDAVIDEDGGGEYSDHGSPQSDISVGAGEYCDDDNSDVIDMEVIMNGRNRNQLTSPDIIADKSTLNAKMQATDANGNITCDELTLNGECDEEKVDEQEKAADEIDGDWFKMEPCTSMPRPSTHSGIIRRSMSDFVVGSGRLCSGLEIRPSTSTNPAMAYIDSESETPESWERDVLYSLGCETTGSLDSMRSTTVDSGEATDTESALDDEVHHLTKEMALSALAGDPDTNSPSYYYSRSGQLWVDKCDRNKCVPNEEIDECYESSLEELFTFSKCDPECVMVGLPVTVRLKAIPRDQSVLEEDDLQVRAYNRAEIFIERWSIEVSKGQQYIVIHILPLLIETCYLVISSFSGHFRSQKVGLVVEGNNPLMSFTEGRDWPIALAADPPAGAVVVVYPHHIVHFSDDGEFIRELLRDPDAYFNDIAVHRDEQLIAVSLSDWIEQMGQTVRNQGLRLYDVHGRLLWQKCDHPDFMLVPVLHMTFDSNANVIVAAKDCICKCSRKSGAFQVQLPLENFGTASRLAVSQERHVLLLDGATCHVHMLNEDLGLLAVIKLDFTSCAMSISNGWSGLAVDRHGFVFVTNCVDNAIMIYTQDGQKAGFIESEWDDVRWPLDIAASSDGHVFVVDHRHACIKKFGYHQLIRTWKERHKLAIEQEPKEESVAWTGDSVAHLMTCCFVRSREINKDLVKSYVMVMGVGDPIQRGNVHLVIWLIKLGALSSLSSHHHVKAMHKYDWSVDTTWCQLTNQLCALRYPT